MNKEIKNTDYIKVFDKSMAEFEILLAVANYIANRTGKCVFVDTCYYDVDLDWKWTTLLAKGSIGTCQILSPRDQMDILFGDNAESISAIERVISRLSK